MVIVGFGTSDPTVRKKRDRRQDAQAEHMGRVNGRLNPNHPILGTDSQDLSMGEKREWQCLTIRSNVDRPI